jgi:predicted alpha/beta superfamily hydrolase
LERTYGGNAEKALRFMRKELMPYVNANYRTDPEDSTIVGHSGGGLFALYVLFREPETFRRYVVSSPSMWWDKKVILKHERRYSQLRSFLGQGRPASIQTERRYVSLLTAVAWTTIPSATFSRTQMLRRLAQVQE